MRFLACHGLKAHHTRTLRSNSTCSLANRATSVAWLWSARRLRSSTTKLIYPEPPTSNHNDFASFLAYAERSGLDPNSTLYVGTHYEYTVAEVLSKYGFYLRRIGGHSDYGTDLLGTWTVPSSAERLRVLVQCKAISRKSAPNLIRELEGAFVGAPIGWRGSGVLGIFVTEKPATKGVRDSLARSKWPMVFICCTRQGALGQMLWNRRAEEEGLETLGVGMKYHECSTSPELILTWKGEHFPMK